MNAKKIIAFLMAVVMVLSLAACSTKETKPAIEGDTNNDGSITVGQEGVEVEVNKVDVHMDSAEAFAAGMWEALFTPVDIEGRKVDMLNFDLTPTAEEKAAMEKEPFYGQPVEFYMSNGCTSGPTVANALGYYTEAGLVAGEGFKGTSAVEALGIGVSTVAVNHIATMLVPITNGVDITFVGGGHIGCKTLYVLCNIILLLIKRLQHAYFPNILVCYFFKSDHYFCPYFSSISANVSAMLPTKLHWRFM